MSILDYKDDDPTIKQEGRYIRRTGKGVNVSRELCKRIGETIGISRIQKVWEGAIMESILKLFGYHEKTANVHNTIRDACLLNVDVKERLDKVKATLNGEYGWFERDANDRDSSE